MRGKDELNKALNVINQAAREQGEDLKDLIRDQYSDLKDVLESGKNRIKSSLKESQEKVQEVIDNVDERVHENPWQFMAGVGTSLLLLGFLTGWTSKRK